MIAAESTRTLVSLPVDMPRTELAAPVDVCRAIISAAVNSMFMVIPQIVSNGFFLWDDGNYLCFDDGSAAYFNNTN